MLQHTTQNSSQIPLGFHCQITIFFIWNTRVCKRRVIFQLIWVGTIVATYYPKFQPNSARISLSNHHFLHLEHTSLQSQSDFSIDLDRYYCCNILPKILAKIRKDVIVKTPLYSIGTCKESPPIINI